MSLPSHIEQLDQLYDAFLGHARRLDNLTIQLIGNETTDSPFPPVPDGPGPKPAHLLGTLESSDYNLRQLVERIGIAINRLETVIQDPRISTASASKY